MKKLVLGLAAVTLGLCTLASCGGVAKENKIGVIIAGSAGDETKGYQTRWEALAKEYGYEMVYEKFKGQDPAYYGECADKLIAAGVKGIICNFEMDGKEAVIEKCINEEVYIGYSGSTVDEETFKEFENEPYFIGQISPTPETEEKQAYDMTKYIVDKYYGPNAVAKPEGTNGLAIWPVDFHGITLAHQMTYRYKGIKKALKEYGVTIVGDNDDDSAKWSATYTNDSILKDQILIMGNNMADYNALQQQCENVLSKNPVAVVSTCMADNLLGMFATKGSMTKGTSFGTLDAFVNDYSKWYKADADNEVPAFRVKHDPYVAGKFSAINEGILAIMLRAINGDPVRSANGGDVSINQNYWVVKTLEEYEAAANTSLNFAWTKADFDGIKDEAALQALYDNATLENLTNALNK